MFMYHLVRASCLAVFLAGIVVVCPAQTGPANNDWAAKVVSLSGSVSVLRDSQPWALNSGDAIQNQQVVVSGPDGHAVFRVSDGSTFEVYPNSNVIFRKNPGNWRDLLDVLVGRVKVHIQKWGGQPNPNRIFTPTAVISVRGTTFDVSVQDEDDSTTVSVEEGQVDVRHALKGGETKVLNAGESIRVSRSEPLAKSMVDKGAVAERVLRGLADALYTVITNAPRGSTGGATRGPTYPGDTAPPPAPAPPPPPPPPAP